MSNFLFCKSTACCARFVFLFFALIIPSISHAQTSAADQLVQILTSIHSLQAQFQQTVFNGRGNAIQQTSGEMAMQRIGKFRWQTQKPGKQLLIADGNKIWFYDVDLRQVTVQKQQTVSGNSPAMLLNGEPSLLVKSYDVSKTESDTDRQVFKLMSKAKQGLFRSVSLTFQDNQLEDMKLVDNFGQVTTVKFSQVENNPTLAPGLFQFTPPEGVDVVKQ